MMKMAMAAMAIATLTACDYAGRKELSRERADSIYRSAMGDYQAGRIKPAIDALKEVCGRDPSNGSARFQLACLLQDHEKDFAGAYCAFLEFLNQHPGSEKMAMAKERMRDCEKEFAVKLAAKYGLDRSSVGKRELDALREELKNSDSRREKLENDLAAAMRRVAFLSGEVARFEKVMEGIGKNESSVASATVDEAKLLLDENSESDKPQATAEIVEAKTLLDGDAQEETSKPVITQPENAKAKRDAAKAAAEGRPKSEAERLREKRPDVYEVQNGDTLYKIAVRFYGHSSAWSRIRDANKALISNDGRIRAGQKLVLPDE